MNTEINIGYFKVHFKYTKYGAKEDEIINSAKHKLVHIYDNGWSYNVFNIYFNSKQTR